MDQKLVAALKTYRDLLDVLMDLSEAELKEMLEYEMSNRPRRSTVERIHQRYSILRAQRERQELIAQIPE